MSTFTPTEAHRRYAETHGLCPDCLHPWWGHARQNSRAGHDRCIGEKCRCMAKEQS